MKIAQCWKTTLVVGLLSAMFFVSAGKAQDNPLPYAYTAVAIGTGGAVGGKTVGFDVRITKWTTDEEIQKYAQLLKEKGQDALRRELEKQDVGRVNPTGSVGNQIAVARRHVQGEKTIVTILTARIMSFGELYKGGRSTDYPFSLITVELNEKGEGTGKVIAMLKVRFDKKKDHYELESFGHDYIKVANARPLK